MLTQYNGILWDCQVKGLASFKNKCNPSSSTSANSGTESGKDNRFQFFDEFEFWFYKFIKDIDYIYIQNRDGFKRF